MLTLRKSEDRGRANFGWLDSRHSFSFADYRDPEQMGFGPLRVINEDRVAGGGGFPPHGHRDMEIISYVLEGALAHKDSTGGGSVIRPGDVQRMSAGTGIRHSEYNASKSEPVHFLQIWIMPGERGIQPSYEQKTFGAGEKEGRLRLIVSPDGAEGSVRIHADARVYASVLGEGQKAELTLRPGRHAWVHVANGAVRLNGKDLGAGDGAAISEEAVHLEGTKGGEVLVFDLA